MMDRLVEIIRDALVAQSNREPAENAPYVLPYIPWPTLVRIDGVVDIRMLADAIRDAQERDE